MKYKKLNKDNIENAKSELSRMHNEIDSRINKFTYDEFKESLDQITKYNQDNNLYRYDGVSKINKSKMEKFNKSALIAYRIFHRMELSDEEVFLMVNDNEFADAVFAQFLNLLKEDRT